MKNLEINSWLEQAGAHEQARAWSEALAAYQQALALDPQNPRIYGRMGLVCEYLGEWGAAESHYRTVLTLEPHAGPVHFYLGRVYQALGRRAEAQVELEIFLTVAQKPDDIKRAKALLAEATSYRYERCFKCGKISQLGPMFRRLEGGGVYCPRCAEQVLSKRSLGMYGLLGLVGVFFLCLRILDWLMQPTGPTDQLFFLVLNMGLVIFFLGVLVIPHELGHALAGRLLGGQVLEIRLGMGPMWCSGWWGNVLLAMGRYPVPAGYCVVIFQNREGFRLRHGLMVAAGMLFNLIMIGWGMLGVVWPEFWMRFGAGVAWRETFVLSNAMAICFSLWPQTVTIGGGQAISDGAQLLQLLLGKMAAETLQLQAFLTAGMHALRRKDYAGVEALSEQGLAEHPGHPMLENLRAVALLEQERHAEAVDLFRELLERFESGAWTGPEWDALTVEMFRAVLRNNVAFGLLLTASSNPRALEEARALAYQAFVAVPWMPAIQGTWGAVLVETGAWEAGIAHLLEARRYHETVRSQVNCLAYAALGYRRLGQTEKAWNLLREAEALDAGEFMVRKIRQEFEGG